MKKLKEVTGSDVTTTPEASLMELSTDLSVEEQLNSGESQSNLTFLFMSKKFTKKYGEVKSSSIMKMPTPSGPLMHSTWDHISSLYEKKR